MKEHQSSSHPFGCFSSFFGRFFIPRSRGSPSPLFHHWVAVLVKRWLGLWEEIWRKGKKGKPSSKQRKRQTFLFAAFFSLSAFGGRPRPLFAGFTSSSVAMINGSANRRIWYFSAAISCFFGDELLGLRGNYWVTEFKTRTLQTWSLIW